MKDGLGDLMDGLHDRTARSHQRFGLFAVDGGQDYVFFDRHAHLTLKPKSTDQSGRNASTAAPGGWGLRPPPSVHDVVPNPHVAADRSPVYLLHPTMGAAPRRDRVP